MKYLVFLLLLVGCGHAYEGYDPIIMNHVQNFRMAAEERGYDVSECPMEFAVTRDDFSGAELGECHGNGISISRSLTEGFFASFSAYAEFVVYHELGHCWLGLPHAAKGIMATGSAPFGWSVARKTDLDFLFATSGAGTCVRRM